MSAPPATSAPTCPSRHRGDGHLREGGPGRPSSTGGPTSPSTRPRTSRRRPPPGLVLAAVPERADPRDALVGTPLADIPAGGRHRHGLGPPPGAAGRGPARPPVRLPAGQHRDSGSQSGRLRRRGRRPRRPRAARTGRPGRRDPRPGGHAAPGGPGRPGRRVPGRRRRHRRGAGRHRRPGRCTGPWTPNGPTSADLGAGCDLRLRGPGQASADGDLRIEVLLASLDGKTVLRARASGADPAALGAEAGRDILEAQGGRSRSADLIASSAYDSSPGGSSLVVGPQPHSHRSKLRQ